MESSVWQPWSYRHRRRLHGLSWLVTGALMMSHAFAFKDGDPYEDMCEIGFHGAAIVNDTWWIHGGYVGYKNISRAFVAPNTYLRSINLTDSFRLGWTGALNIMEDPADVPTLSSGAYWAFGDSLYEVVGEVERAEEDYHGFAEPRHEGQITIYDIVDGTYKATNITMGSRGPLRRVSHPLDAQVPNMGKGKGFLLGGVIRTGNETRDKQEWAKEDVAWMTVYDHETEAWNQWRAPWKWRTYGLMVHVPIGKNGLLVTIGGYNGTSDPETDRPAGPETGPMPMDMIDVYNLDLEGEDNEPGVWMDTQIATAGDPRIGIPRPLVNACSVVAVAPDNSTAQIFVWGGSVAASSPYITLGELWVLSLPSFEWFRLMNDMSGLEGQTNPGEREGMTCNAFGKYMLMYGGRKFPNFSRTCETSGIYALDMAEGDWIETWPGAEVAKKEQYTIPPIVVDGIGGTIHGINRTDKMKQPVEGFADARLKAVFDWHEDNRGRDEGQYGREPEYSDSPRTPPVETNTPEPEPEPEGPPLGPTAIAGIAVGTVVFIAFGALAFWFIRRRRARKDDGFNPYGKSELAADEDTAPVRTRFEPDSQPVVEADGTEKAAELDDYQKKQAWMLENVFELDGVSPAVERPPQELDAVSPQRGNPRVELDAVSPACSVKLEFF